MSSKVVTTHTLTYGQAFLKAFEMVIITALVAFLGFKAANMNTDQLFGLVIGLWFGMCIGFLFRFNYEWLFSVISVLSVLIYFTLESGLTSIGLSYGIPFVLGAFFCSIIRKQFLNLK